MTNGGNEFRREKEKEEAGIPLSYSPKLSRIEDRNELTEERE